MSIEMYEVPTDKGELYRLLDEGEEAVCHGNKRSLEEVMYEIRAELGDEL